MPEKQAKQEDVSDERSHAGVEPKSIRLQQPFAALKHSCADGRKAGDLFERLTKTLLRKVATWLHRMLVAYWFVRRPRTFGAHAVAFTPRSTIVLVKLRYAKGWRLPGGGMKEGEHPGEAALRELREEIGMTSHGAVQLAGELQENPDWKRDTASLVIVHDVEYTPKWNWEVEEVIEAVPSNLPADMSPRALKWLAAVKPLIQ